MKSTTLKHVLLLVLSLTFLTPALAEDDPALFLGRANARVAHAMKFANNWDGPTSGPKMQTGKLVVIVGGDLTEPRHDGDKSQDELRANIQDIAKSVGWNTHIINCYGLPGRHSDAVNRASALNPAAIILLGVDAASPAKEIAAVNAKKIPVIGWHAALSNGPGSGLFTNIGTDPKEVGQLAALLSVVESKAREGVVVFADNSSYYNTTKSSAIAEIIKQCQTCNLLSVEQIPPGEKAEKMADRVAGLIKTHGAKWTHLIAISDRYLDTMEDPLVQKALNGAKIAAIAAGDGSKPAYKRIRSKSMQLGTVPEPLELQAYQLIDEVNRAISGDKPSGYVTASYIVTAANASFHGGPKDIFEPANGYRDEYKKIWTR